MEFGACVDSLQLGSRDLAVQGRVCSGSAPLDESWVQTDVSDVMSVQQPG